MILWLAWFEEKLQDYDPETGAMECHEKTLLGLYPGHDLARQRCELEREKEARKRERLGYKAEAGLIHAATWLGTEMRPGGLANGIHWLIERWAVEV